MKALKMANIEVIDGYFSRNSSINKESRSAWGLIADEKHNDLESLCRKHEQRVNDNLVAVVLTPTTSHYQDMKCLLGYKYNIICEKPLAVTKEELIDVARYAKRKEKNNSMYNYGGYPMFREMAEQVK